MTAPEFHFSHLTPDLLINAIESIGIYPASGLLPLNSYENRVYQFQDDNRKRWVVKFYRPERWDNEQILEEHNFTLALEEAGIAVAAPLVQAGTSLFEYLGYRFSLFPSVGGRTFEIDDLDQLEQVARTLGQIHQLSQTRPFKHRPEIGLDEYLFTPRKVLENQCLIPDSLSNTFFSDLDLLIQKTQSGWQQATPIIALHGDCHPSNILWDEQPIFVDWDDARNGPAIQDLWLLLHGSLADQRLQLDILIEGYECFATFPYQQLQLIEPLRSLRMVHYMAWLAKRWQDPAFPRAFPWFAEAKYWENQILGMKEQLAALDAPKLSPSVQW